MEFFFFVIFIIIISNIFGAAKKGNKGKAQPWGQALQKTLAELENAQNKSNHDGNSSSSAGGGREWNELTSRIKKVSASQAAQFGKRQARQRERAREARISSPQKAAGDSKDADDRNRHRRSDWGARVGPGFLSSRNMIFFAAFLIILGILSQMPSHMFR